MANYFTRDDCSIRVYRSVNYTRVQKSASPGTITFRIPVYRQYLLKVATIIIFINIPNLCYNYTVSTHIYQV